MAAPHSSASGAPERETATLGGGCFWCLEAVFAELRGVESVESGYSGGSLDNPGYEQVCSGTTGHAEVVRIVFDPRLIRYRDILDVFFAIHDPTTLNRQGNDRGTQYRSVIFHHSARQKADAEETIARLAAAGTWEAPVVTELQPAAPFFKAEAHHQKFFANHPGQPYCRAVVAPKLEKFRRRFPAWRKGA